MSQWRDPSMNPLMDPSTNPTSLTGCSSEAEALLQAAERALFDATTRLHEAVALIDRQGLEAPPEALERVRHWASMIHRGLDRVAPQRSVPNVLEFRLKA